MTNQASEVELRAEIAQYLESTYQDGAVMATRPNSGYHKRVDEFTDKLLALIRTEKLKLLAEVRERVVGEDDEQSLRELSRDIAYEVATVLFEINTTRNVLKREQRESLEKMEAEL